MSFVRKTKGATSSPSSSSAPSSPPSSSSAPGPQSRGTRACPTGGPPIISTGCADLDRVLGGGLPLGTLSVFAEDGWTHHAALFLKYFVSEAVAVGQSVGVVRHEHQPCEGAGHFLLRRMSKSDAMKEEAAERAEVAAAREATKLRIAWQYEKYAKSAQGGGPETGVHPGRLALGKSGASPGSKGPWCHDHDIRKAPSEEDVRRMLGPADGKGGGHVFHKTFTIRPGAGLVAQVVSAARSFSAEVCKIPEAVGRLVIPSLGDATWDMEADAVVNALSAIRSIIQQEPRIAVAVGVPLRTMRTSDAKRIMYVSDACFSLAAVEDTSSLAVLSSDPKTVSGAMEIVRLPKFGSIRSPLPEVRSYVVRNRRRRLALEVFDVDPDAEAGGDAPSALKTVDW